MGSREGLRGMHILATLPARTPGRLLHTMQAWWLHLKDQEVQQG